jgi:hypothetical protein
MHSRIRPFEGAGTLADRPQSQKACFFIRKYRFVLSREWGGAAAPAAILRPPLQRRPIQPGDPYMSKAEQNTNIPEEELQSDGVADSIAAVMLVVLAVVAMVYWVAGH